MFKKGSCFSLAAVKTRRLLTDQPCEMRRASGRGKDNLPPRDGFSDFAHETTRRSINGVLREPPATTPESPVQICPSIEWRQVTSQVDCLMYDFGGDKV